MHGPGRDSLARSTGRGMRRARSADSAHELVEELNRLSSQELHDRAYRYAERHVDVGFFWSLIELMPAAEQVEGQPQQAAADVVHWGQQVLDAVKRDPKLIDALRPAYIDYLQKHPDA